MKIVFIINTVAQAYTWQYVIRNLEQNHDVKIIARDAGLTLKALKEFGFEYESFKPIKAKIFKIFEIFNHLTSGYKVGRKFKADIFIGFGIDASLTAKLLNKKSIVFTDGESIPVQNSILKHTANVIITPACFRVNLGKNHIRVEGYKELAYLHPNYFKPDPSVFSELGLAMNEKYIILRFCAFGAVHDIGKKGFSLADKETLVKTLEKYARVFISSEGCYPPTLEKYRLPTSHGRVHHVLYYAQMLVGDSQTSTTESAVLGTPAIRCNNFVGPNEMGNFMELEQKYDLLYSFSEPDRAINKAVELINKPNLKEEWGNKRLKLLEDKIDLTNFLVDFIENYPESFKELKAEQAIK
jgi:hypothetical protein